MSFQPRVIPGVPTGGQWAAKSHTESTLLLDGPQALTAAQLSERHRELGTEGYCAPIANSTLNPSSVEQRKKWWDEHFVASEYGHDSGGFAQMPDDYTPAMTGGNSLEGNRRTHRMRYAGHGVAMRMPSAASIRRYDSENSGTFDVPVSAEFPGGTVTGWVRVSRNGPQSWHATGLGFPEGADAYVAEAVSAVMESRRPSQALREAGDLVDRRRTREATTGQGMTPVNSHWISEVGYDDSTGTMAVRTARGDTYGYQVDRATYEKVATAQSPGSAYNKMVKGQPRGAVNRCEQCGRFASAGNAHICPSVHAERPGHGRVGNAGQRLAGVYASGGYPQAYPPPVRPVSAPPAEPELLNAAASSEHQLDPNESGINLLQVLARQGRQPLTVPTYWGRRGWTTGVADTLGPNTSSTYNPSSFADKPYTAGHYTNGDMGLVRFAGVNSAQAVELLRSIPEVALHDGQNDGPSLRASLTAVRDNPGVLEAGGYVVGPDRPDERVTVESFHAFVNTDSREQAWAQVAPMLGLDPAVDAPPDELDRMDTPWRPGQKAWRLWWD